MAQPVLVKDADGAWREPSVVTYGNERELQNLVVRAPELLTGRALATADEFWIPGIGSVDIVGVGAEGDIAVVECKLRANPEIRSEVVGQLLAYAGGLWQMSYEDFAATWSSRTSGSLAADVRRATEMEIDDEDLRRGVTENLARGTFTLVVAVDEITEELKRIIEYLNGATRDEVKVLGLELQYVKEGGTEILIPRTYGEGLKKVQTGASTNTWTAERFDDAIAQLHEPDRSVIEELMVHGREYGSHPWWGVGQTPGMSWYYGRNGTKLSFFQIYLRPNGAVVSPSIGGLAGSPQAGTQIALAMLERLRGFEPFRPFLEHVSEENINRYPAIPAAVLAELGGVEAFLAAVDFARGSGD